MNGFPRLQQQRRARMPQPVELIRLTFAALIRVAYSRCPRLFVCSGSPKHLTAQLQVGPLFREHQPEIPIRASGSPSDSACCFRWPVADRRSRPERDGARSPCLGRPERRLGPGVNSCCTMRILPASRSTSPTQAAQSPSGRRVERQGVQGRGLRPCRVAASRKARASVTVQACCCASSGTFSRAHRACDQGPLRGSSDQSVLHRLAERLVQDRVVQRQRGCRYGGTGVVRLDVGRGSSA